METLAWLMFQMGGVGPMLGQAHHFLRFNPGKAPYAEKRYGDEARRLYDVMDKRLGASVHLGGADYSIADVATWPWISRHEWQGVSIDEYPAVKRWYEEIKARPAVQRGYDVPRMGHQIP
jgi:GST-like protein